MKGVCRFIGLLDSLVCINLIESFTSCVIDYLKNLRFYFTVKRMGFKISYCVLFSYLILPFSYGILAFPFLLYRVQGHAIEILSPIDPHLLIL